MGSHYAIFSCHFSFLVLSEHPSGSIDSAIRKMFILPKIFFSISLHEAFSVCSGLSWSPYLSFSIISPCFTLFLVYNHFLKLFLYFLVYFPSSLVRGSWKIHFTVELALMSALKTGHEHCRYMLNVCWMNNE